jgi:hypothetical protein
MSLTSVLEKVDNASCTIRMVRLSSLTRTIFRRRIYVNSFFPLSFLVNRSPIQTFMSGTGPGGQPAPYFGQYAPDFFDFISSASAIEEARITSRTGVASSNTSPRQCGLASQPLRSAGTTWIPITAAAFLHLGNRTAVFRTLRTLAKGGDIPRVAHGVYVAAIVSRFGRHAPQAHLFVQQLAAESEWPSLPFGAATANDLGLTTQVPAHAVDWTCGRTRSYKVGKLAV